ncbi:hypothetical protein [Rossellomorea marisflavi]|uniref:hypothetical protein n=1 Tax=Rossellomorea marisflavi TaxID=189381 RepID=UPI003FA0E040
MIFFIIGVILIFTSVVNDLKVKKRIEQMEKIKTKDTKDTLHSYPNAKVWVDALRSLGESPDEDKLIKISQENGTPPNEIPFRAVFQKDDYLSLLTKMMPKKNWWEESKNGYGGNFYFSTLESAIYVKRLNTYINTLEDSIKMLEEKSNGVTLSTKAKEKLDSMKIELESKNKELDLAVYFEGLPENMKRIAFSKVAIKQEDEILEEIEKQLKASNPGVKQFVLKEVANPSPALIELKEFLKNHKLPDEYEMELRKTMEKIEEKLNHAKDEKEKEKLLSEAMVLNDSAKMYHNIQ